MKRDFVIRILWLLFGISLFKAIDSIIISVAYFTFHQMLENNYAFNTKIKGFIFGVILVSYLLVFVSFIIFITKKLRKKEFDLNKNIPKILFFLVAVIAIILEPLTLYLSDKKIKSIFDDLNQLDYISSINLSSLEGFLNNTIFACKWTTFTLLIIYLFILLSRLNKKGL